MKRRMLHLLTALSLLLWVAVAASYALGFYRVSRITLVSHQTQVGIAVFHGKLRLSVTRGPGMAGETGPGGWRWLAGWEPINFLRSGGARALALPEARSHRVNSPPLTSHVLDVPLWVPLLLTSALPAIALRTGLRRRSRAARGTCRRCGYDLTGNASGVCPECGTIARAEPAA